jgi:hypothetical protein
VVGELEGAADPGVVARFVGSDPPVARGPAHRGDPVVADPEHHPLATEHLEPAAQLLLGGGVEVAAGQQPPTGESGPSTATTPSVAAAVPRSSSSHAGEVRGRRAG